MPFGSKSTAEENANYLAGMCRNGCGRPLRPAGTECERCFQWRTKNRASASGCTAECDSGHTWTGDCVKRALEDA